MVAKKRKIKKSYRSTFFSTFLGFLILIVIVLLIFSNFKISQRRVPLLSQIESLEQEIKTLEEKITQLRANISQTDKEIYWEERVREQGFVKEGENQVVVIPPESNLEQEKEQGGSQGFFGELLEKIKSLWQE